MNNHLPLFPNSEVIKAKELTKIAYSNVPQIHWSFNLESATMNICVLTVMDFLLYGRCANNFLRL